jgi:outer membrane protein assembly factor BamD (BamD/ComL family)
MNNTTGSVHASFEKKIQQWVAVDNRLKELNEQTKELRQQRSDANDAIIEYIQTNKLSNAVINITDGKLKFGEMKQTAPITLGFLEKCLGEVITNSTQVDQIMTYIKQKREVKVIPEIKRYYNNNPASSKSGGDVSSVEPDE